MLGLLATAGAVLSVLLTLVAESLGRASARRATESMITRTAYAEAGRRNAEVIRAMGLSNRFGRLWSEQSLRFLKDQRRVSDVVGAAGTLSRTLRMMLQSLMLGLGAYLVMSGEASSGVIIASSIMLARALAPVDIAIANWRGFMSARQSYAQLSKTLTAFADRQPADGAAAADSSTLSVEALTVAAPGQQKPLIQNVTFTLDAGAGLGVIGPSASGKSTLVARPRRRLAGAARHGPSRPGCARAVGRRGAGPRHRLSAAGHRAVRRHGCRKHLPASTRTPMPKDILAAAQAAGVDQMILRLPDGFQTRVGDGGAALSAGQRQLVGLARALYGDPFLVVLDEPNSNLDADGDVSLAKAIQGVRQRGGIVIVVAHRPSALANLDQVLVMAGGTMQAFGPKDEVLASVTRPAAQPQQPAAHAAVAANLDCRFLLRSKVIPMSSVSEKRAGSGEGIRANILFGLAVSVLLVGGVGAWAATTSLAGAVIASGNVVVESNAKKVQHQTGGIVGAILVAKATASRRAT